MGETRRSDDGIGSRALAFFENFFSVKKAKGLCAIQQISQSDEDLIDEVISQHEGWWNLSKLWFSIVQKPLWSWVCISGHDRYAYIPREYLLERIRRVLYDKGYMNGEDGVRLILSEPHTPAPHIF